MHQVLPPEKLTQASYKLKQVLMPEAVCKVLITFTSLILRDVARGDGELGCLCGKAGTSHLCDGSAHSSGCVVNGYGCYKLVNVFLVLCASVPSLIV